VEHISAHDKELQAHVFMAEFNHNQFVVEVIKLAMT
jgi:hypothetical protein